MKRLPLFLFTLMLTGAVAAQSNSAVGEDGFEKLERQIERLRENATRIQERESETNEMASAEELSEALLLDLDELAGDPVLEAVGRIVNAYMKALIEHRQEYMTALERAGWENILYPEAAQYRTEEETLDVIYGATKALSAFEKRMEKENELFSEAVVKLAERSGYSSSEKARVHADLYKLTTYQEALIDLEWKILKKFGHASLVLANSNWIIDGEQPVFSSDAAMDEYNGYYTEGMEAAEKQEKLRQRLIQRGNSSRKGR